jgi:hypothetical protein
VVAHRESQGWVQVAPMPRTPDTGQPRERVLRFRCSEAEAAEILAAAETAPTLSDWVREVLLERARRSDSPPTSP